MRRNGFRSAELPVHCLLYVPLVNEIAAIQPKQLHAFGTAYLPFPTNRGQARVPLERRE